MGEMLEDQDSHCLFFSPIIRIIFDWGKGLTSVFVIPWVCNTTWHRTWTVVSLGVDGSVMHNPSGTRLLDTWCIFPHGMQQSFQCPDLWSLEPLRVMDTSLKLPGLTLLFLALFHSLTAHMLFLPSSRMLTPEITDLLRWFFFPSTLDLTGKV